MKHYTHTLKLLVALTALVFAVTPAAFADTAETTSPATNITDEVIIPHDLAVEVVREIAPDRVGDVRRPATVPWSTIKRHDELFLRHIKPDRSVRELLLYLSLTD